MTLTITGDDEIKIATYPGIHAQILTNLITNSVRHGFNSKENNHIVIDINKKNDTVEVHYYDNGIGLSDEVKKHIFEPFFTTGRQEGGVGLGMSIIYNLITQTLQGEILIDNNIKTGAGLLISSKKAFKIN